VVCCGRVAAPRPCARTVMARRRIRPRTIRRFSAVLRGRWSSDQYARSAAVAVTKARLLPRNVPSCSPGRHTSSSGRMSVRAIGRPYPLRDLDRHTISGAIPAASKLKNGPVRPQPAWMSSMMRGMSAPAHKAARRCNHGVLAVLIPPSPCTASTMTAAGGSIPLPGSSRKSSNRSNPQTLCFPKLS
jgi:hypothetical protein